MAEDSIDVELDDDYVDSDEEEEAKVVTVDPTKSAQKISPNSSSYNMNIPKSLRRAPSKYRLPRLHSDMEPDSASNGHSNTFTASNISKLIVRDRSF